MDAVVMAGLVDGAVFRQAEPADGAAFHRDVAVPADGAAFRQAEPADEAEPEGVVVFPADEAESAGAAALNDARAHVCNDDALDEDEEVALAAAEPLRYNKGKPPLIKALFFSCTDVLTVCSPP